MRWDLESVKQIVKDHCDKRVDLQRDYKGAYLWAQRRGLLEEVYQGMPSSHTPTYTTESAKESSLKYTSRKSFLECDRGNYEFAVRNGTLASITTHMPSRPRKYTISELGVKALKYKHKVDFKKGSPKFYDAACSYGVVDEICKHMEPKNSDNNVVYLWKVKEIPCVYKIGVTSLRLGSDRVEYVAREAGLTIEWVKSSFTEDARLVERALLSFGRPYLFGEAFNGSTEFKNLTETELKECLKLMEARDANPT